MAGVGVTMHFLTSAAITFPEHGVNKDEVVKAFSSLSFKQLRGVFVEYYKLAERTLGEAFDLVYKGEEKTNMHALCKCCSLDTLWPEFAQTRHVPDLRSSIYYSRCPPFPAVQCLNNRHAYLASALHKALAGPGTKDRDLIRLIVSRAEVDLLNIEEEYFKMYNKTLDSDVKVGEE